MILKNLLSLTTLTILVAQKYKTSSTKRFQGIFKNCIKYKTIHFLDL